MLSMYLSPFTISNRMQVEMKNVRSRKTALTISATTVKIHKNSHGNSPLALSSPSIRRKRHKSVMSIVNIVIEIGLKLSF